MIACSFALAPTFSQEFQRRGDVVAVGGRDALTGTMNTLRLSAVQALLSDSTEALLRLSATYCVDTASRGRDTIPLLTIEERTLVLFHMGQYALLLQDIDSGTHFYSVPELRRSERPAASVRHNSASLSQGLREYWRANAQKRLRHIGSTIPDTADRQLLSTYWMRTINDLLAFPQDNTFTNEEVNAKAWTYLSTSSDSLRSAFASRFLLRKRPRRSPGWGMDLGFGGVYPTGAAEKSISGASLFRVGYDFTYRGLYAGLHVNMGWSTVERPFTLDSITTLTGELVRTGGVGAYVGFRVLETGRFRLIPNASVGQMTFTYNSEDGQREQHREEVVIARGELIADIKLNLVRADVRNLGGRGWWNGMPVAHSCLRFRFGWQPEKAGSTLLGRSGFYYFTAGLAGYIVSQRRVR